MFCPHFEPVRVTTEMVSVRSCPPQLTISWLRHTSVAVARLANEFGRHRLRSPVTIHHAVREFTRAWIHESPDIGMMQEPDAVWRELPRQLFQVADEDRSLDVHERVEAEGKVD